MKIFNIRDVAYNGLLQLNFSYDDLRSMLVDIVEIINICRSCCDSLGEYTNLTLDCISEDLLFNNPYSSGDYPKFYEEGLFAEFDRLRRLGRKSQTADGQVLSIVAGLGWWKLQDLVIITNRKVDQCLHQPDARFVEASNTSSFKVLA